MKIKYLFSNFKPKKQQDQNFITLYIAYTVPRTIIDKILLIEHLIILIALTFFKQKNIYKKLRIFFVFGERILFL